MTLGIHVIAEFYGVNYAYLNSPGFLKLSIELAVKEAKMHLRKVVYEKFIPQGVTIFAILAESHLAIHTWPEKGCAAVECFTCGAEGYPWKALEILKDRLEPSKVNIRELKR